MSGQMRRRGVMAAAMAALLASACASSAFAAGLPRVAIKTSRGTIVVEVDTQHAPITANNFLHYVDTQKYDGGNFYRAARTPTVANDGTIVGGTKPGTHGWPPIAHEPTTKTGLRHKNGTISIGRFSPGSATSDFFICAADQPYLDAHPGAKGDNLGFAAFGHVVSGMNVVLKILNLPANGHSPFPDQKGQWLTKPVAIETMRRVG